MTCRPIFSVAGSSIARQAGRALRVPATTFVLATLASLISATGALAALPAGCTAGDQTMTCAYGYSGAGTRFTVPSGVSSLRILAVGAPGGSQAGSAGGTGATASAGVVVTGGEMLYVEVGGPGSDYTQTGGFNGGGASSGFGDASGGGGASDVRTGSSSASGSLDSRLVVAGGGGGSGDAGFEPDNSQVAPGDGAAAGKAGSTGSSDTEGDPGGNGGQPGTLTAGGAGGSGGVNAIGESGPGSTTGTPGKGGDGGSYSNLGGSGGGGGGGGYYGGGGGGAGGRSTFAGGGGAGGGGGSSYAPGGSIGVAATGAAPSVTISYTLRVTSTDVSCSSDSVQIGTGTTCTAIVTDTDTRPVIAPTGTVGFSSDSSGSFSDGAVCTLAAAGIPGEASCHVSYTPSTAGSGTHAITAAYGPDLTHASSQGSRLLGVTRIPTTTALSAPGSRVVTGQNVTYTATVRPAPLGGGVTFSVKGRALPGCRAVAIDQMGMAVCHDVQRAVGKRTVRAGYLGDSRSAPSGSNELTEAVKWSLSLHGRPALRGKGVRLILTCAPRSRGCHAVAALTVAKTVRGRTRAHSRAARRTVTVPVGSATARIRAGKTRRLTARLDADGRRLLARHPHARVKLTISLIVRKHRTTVTTRKLRNLTANGRQRR